MSTVKQLLERLQQFPEDAQVLLGLTPKLSKTESAYYVNVAVSTFSAKEPRDSDLCIIRASTPYTKVPYDVVEAGWRPGNGS